MIARETYLDLHLRRRALRLGVLRRLRPRQHRQVLLHARHGARARAPPPVGNAAPRVAHESRHRFSECRRSPRAAPP